MRSPEIGCLSSVRDEHRSSRQQRMSMNECLKLGSVNPRRPPNGQRWCGMPITDLGHASTAQIELASGRRRSQTDLARTAILGVWLLTLQNQAACVRGPALRHAVHKLRSCNRPLRLHLLLLPMQDSSPGLSENQGLKLSSEDVCVLGTPDISEDARKALSLESWQPKPGQTNEGSRRLRGRGASSQPHSVTFQIDHIRNAGNGIS